MTAEHWALIALDGKHGTLRMERDLSLGHHRLRLGPIKLFWKSTPGWEFNFLADEEEVGFQVVAKDKAIHING